MFFLFQFINLSRFNESNSVLIILDNSCVNSWFLILVQTELWIVFESILDKIYTVQVIKILLIMGWMKRTYELLFLNSLILISSVSITFINSAFTLVWLNDWTDISANELSLSYVYDSVFFWKIKWSTIEIM